MSFRENLRKFRADLGMTQEELAKSVRVSSQAVSKWECGSSMPDPDLLPILADALDVSLDRLLDRNHESFQDLAWHLSAFLGDGGIHDLRRVACLAVCGWDAETLSRQLSVTLEDGFAVGSDSAAFPFLCIFEEPKAGWKALSESADRMREIFAMLAKPGRIEAVCALLARRPVTFDVTYAAASLGMDGETLEELCLLGLLEKSKLEINGRETVLYHPCPGERLLALLLLAAFLHYDNAHFDFQSSERESPLLREK